MPEPITAEVSPEDLRQHSAVQAWAQLGPERVEPDSIEVLQFKGKSAAYRLSGVGPRGSAIIAKRSSLACASLERFLYQEVLADLGIPVLRCYGFLNTGENAWLFLENAEGQTYCSDDCSHRAAAGVWLGKLHCSSLALDLSDRLPNRDFGHYLELLSSVRALLRGWLGRSILPQQDACVLEVIVSGCDELEAHWPELEELCCDLPRTVVHCDFVRKNLRVRLGPPETALLVFDWEYAGWGVPAVDLVQFVDGTASPDLASYGSVVGRHRPCELERTKGWAECGRFFRLLDNIDWACAAVEPTDYRHLSKPLSYLRVYEGCLKQALEAAPWAGRRSCRSHA